MNGEEEEKWGNLFLLAEVASDQLHATVSVTKAAIEAPVEPRQNRAMFLHPFVFVPRKKRNPLVRKQRPSQNPRNRSSSSPSPSSSSHAVCKRRMKRPLMDAEEEKQGIPLKQRKKYYSGSTSYSSIPAREIPLWLVNVMRKMNGYEPKLIIKKNLFKTDISRNHGRLAIPSNRVVEKDFLTSMEEAMINEKCRFKTSDVDLESVLVDPCCCHWNVVLRRWDMTKSSGNYTSSFVLVSSWNSIVAANGFKERDPIELWSFRSDGRLCFALVPPRLGSFISGQSSSAL